MRTKLSPRLETLIRHAVKTTGTFNPDEALTCIEEDLTKDEFDLASAFLGWVYCNNLTFGHGNIHAVFAEFRKASPANTARKG